MPETFTVKRATNKVRASHDGHAYHEAWAARSALKFRRKHGDSCVERVIRYDFATNRPINPNLLAAITALRSGAAAVDDVARQAEQISTAIQSAAIEIRSFLGRLKLSGSRGSLKQVDRAGHQVLAAWGEASDPESEKRLLKVHNLIRNKFRSEEDGLQRPFRVGLLPPAVVVQPARRLSGGEASDSL